MESPHKNDLRADRPTDQNGIHAIEKFYRDGTTLSSGIRSTVMNPPIRLVDTVADKKHKQTPTNNNLLRFRLVVKTIKTVKTRTEVITEKRL